MIIDQINSVTLPHLNGSRLDIAGELARKPILLVFYKYNCPTCQFALPFIERLYRKYGDGKFKFIAVAQDNEPETAQFRREYGLNFDIALDKSPYEFSQMFDFQAVPAVYLISQDGRVWHKFESFQKSEFERLNRELADSGETLKPLFGMNEDIPALKPG